MSPLRDNKTKNITNVTAIKRGSGNNARNVAWPPAVIMCPKGISAMLNDLKQEWRKFQLYSFLKETGTQFLPLHYYKKVRVAHFLAMHILLK